MAGEVRKLQFSDGVVVSEPTDLTAGLVVPEATSSLLGTVKKNKWQQKLLAADQGASGPIPSLTFNNLVVGKIYRVSAQVFFEMTGTTVTETISFTCFHSATGNIFIARHRNDGQIDVSNQQALSSAIFKATSSTVTFSCGVSGTGSVSGDNTRDQTWVMLEQLDNYADATTDFT